MNNMNNISIEIDIFSELSNEYIYLIERLNLISRIKVGETICLTNKKIMKYKTLYTAAYRWYNNENRFKCREWILETFEIYKKHISKCKNIQFGFIQVSDKLRERIMDLDSLYSKAYVGYNNFEKNYETI